LTVDVIAIRQRPPYDYGDLEELLKDFNRNLDLQIREPPP